MNDIENVLKKIRRFRDERDWMQFHNPKDMATAISIEAAELLEIFLWKTPAEVEQAARDKREHIEEELADISAFLFELADNLDIDLVKAIESKLEKNAQKYPVDKAKGKHTKYTDL